MFRQKDKKKQITNICSQSSTILSSSRSRSGPGQVPVMPWSWSMSRFKSTTKSKLKFHSHNLKSMDLERHYNQMSPPPPPPPPLNFSKHNIIFKVQVKSSSLTQHNPPHPTLKSPQNTKLSNLCPNHVEVNFRCLAGPLQTNPNQIN